MLRNYLTPFAQHVTLPLVRTVHKAPKPAAKFGAKLRFLRRLRRLTQDELASKSGLSRTTINNLEQGDYFPSIDTLVRLDKALGQQVETVILDEAS